MGDFASCDCICMELPHIPQTDDAQPKILHGAPLTAGLPKTRRTECQSDLSSYGAVPRKDSRRLPGGSNVGARGNFGATVSASRGGNALPRSKEALSFDPCRCLI